MKRLVNRGDLKPQVAEEDEKTGWWTEEVKWHR